VFCKDCGREAVAEVTFCPGCGSRLPTADAKAEEPERRFCADCGRELAVDSYFCSACGAEHATEASETKHEVGSTVSPRPWGITFAAVCFRIFGVLYIVMGICLMLGVASPDVAGSPGRPKLLTASAIALVLGIPSLIVGNGLKKCYRWSLNWSRAILVTSIAATFAEVAILGGWTSIVWLAISLVEIGILVYLVRPGVRAHFG
jgi:RNA polymerase subunit RPABC4/transcription elongation factor Spt4